MAFDDIPTIIKLIVEPKIDPSFTNLPVSISLPGMKELNAETTDEYKKTKNIVLVVSKVLSL